MDANDIKKLRKAIGMTQEEFAYRLGITVTTVSNWELGKRVPSRLGKQILKQVMREENIGAE